MNKLNIFTYTNKEYLGYVTSYLLPSIPKSVRNIDIVYAASFPELQHCQMIQRLEIMHDKIIEYINQPIAFLDADVIITRDFTDDVLDRLTKYDILFQDNTQWYNSGVWVANCNTKVANLFVKFIEELERKSYELDQTIIWEVINKTDISHTKLPIEYFAGHFDQLKFPNFPKDMYLYHATNTYTSEEKRAALELVKNKFHI